MNDKELRRCTKALIYIFSPDKGAEDKGHQYGRIQLFDEHGKKVSGKMKAFVDGGQMLMILLKHHRKLIKLRNGRTK